ncbi:MAG: CPBP family intramembrane metalloprotease [Oscillospiraceae bacterium]|nr:CPBP family intramembrane metalloprotease [Oscillospiraceae bacterium]
MDNTTTYEKIIGIIFPPIVLITLNHMAYGIAGLFQIILNAINSADVESFDFSTTLYGNVPTVIQSIIILLLCKFVFIPMWKETKEQAPTKLLKNNAILIAITTIIMFSGIDLLTNQYMTVTGLRDHSSYAHLKETFSSWSAFKAIISAVIIAPITEELCLRGVVQGRLMTWAKPWVAILVQAIIFAIIHMNLIQASYAFFAGIFLGILYYRFRKLWPCILAHMVFNFSTSHFFLLFLSRFIEEFTNLHYLVFGIVLTLLGGFLLLMLPAAVPIYVNVKDPIKEP